MRKRLPGHGFTVFELVASLAVVIVLMAMLLPALSSARISSHREQCQSNQRQIGVAWLTYLADHEDSFPFVPVQPAWLYAGARFSAIDDTPYPDYERPLTAYLPGGQSIGSSLRAAVELLRCPADHGIAGDLSDVGTGDRTVFRSFGTSYRANAALLDSRLANIAGAATGSPRGIRRSEITAQSSRLVIMGGPFWYEVRERTGRTANWHRVPGAGNLLFLDGSVRFMTIEPKPKVGPAVFDPVLPGTVYEHTSQD